MDKINKNEPINKAIRPHSITIEGRKKIAMTGIEKVRYSNETAIVLTSSEGELTLSGKNLKINSYNVSDGTFSAEGEVDGVKYSAKKTPVLKRLFK